MKKEFLLWGAMSFLSMGLLSAQNFHLQPTPQEYHETEGRVALPTNYTLKVDASLADAPAVRLLKTVLPVKGCCATAKSDFTISLGVRGDKSVKKVSRRIPKQVEGYYLQVSEKGITVAGSDQRGLYYGVQTLAQLVAQGELPLTEVTDYPDIRWRGVVEGFYGTPWSHEARLRQLDFYGKNKMNVYLYGPKNDPYHSTPNWRKPYPEKEAAQLKELVDRAKENEVVFYWAIHPGQDIKWNTEDRDNLIQKFEKMYDLGVRAFAVFFDDISGEGVKASKQAELLNYVDDNFVKVKGDVAPLVMCPTEYNKSWSNVKGGYLTTLGSTLNKDIEIMWTGDRVIACIDKQSMGFINPLLQRKAYIWWNFPVSDYVRDHLLMGRIYGNSKDIKDDMSAFISNPMERPEASKISIYSVADYAWNLEEFDSEASWREAIKDLMPEHPEAMQLFANHHSDLGVNGHNFRREESVEFTPIIERFLDAYQKDGVIAEEDYTRVLKECNDIIYAADVLMASKSNRMLIDEIRPWLMQFKQVGEYGKAVLGMMQAEQSERKIRCGLSAEDALRVSAFMKQYTHAQAIQNLIYQVDAAYNQNRFQPGVKSCSKIVFPNFQKLFEVATARYNHVHKTDLDELAVYMPYTLESDVKQLSLLPMRQRGNTGIVSPSNEVIIWQADGQVTVSMDYARTLNKVELNLGTDGAENNFKLEVSADGTSWETVALITTHWRRQLIANLAGKKVLKVRLSNASGGEQKVYFKKFVITEKTE